MTETLHFLNLLFGGCEAGYVYSWHLKDKLSKFYSVTELAAMAAAVAGGNDAYFGVGGVAAPIPGLKKDGDKRASVPDVTFLPGLWIDVDIQGDGHKYDDLPPDMAAALEIVPNDMPPSLIVHTGGGIHLYWLFKEPWYFDTSEERDQAQSLSERWQRMLKGRAAEHKWRLDATHDLARVLRLPGTYNAKIQPLRPCTVMHEGADRYNQTEIADYLDRILPTEAAAPEEAKASAAAQPERDKAERFKRLPSDGSAELISQNCAFVQHCQLNANSLHYEEWIAMLANVARGKEGIETAHRISALDAARYDRKNTDLKIAEVVREMNPPGCAYIQATLGFKGCPAGGCGFKAPCGWALHKAGRAKALIRQVAVDPQPEAVFSGESLAALAIVEKEDPAEYATVKAALKGSGIDTKDLIKAVKKSRLTVVTEDTPPADGETMLRQMLPDAPIDLRLPSSFAVDEFGIVMHRMGENGERKYKASGMPVIVTRILANIDDNKEQVEVSWRKAGYWHSTVVDRSVISTTRKITVLADYGVAVNSETSKYLVMWLSNLMDINQDLIPVFAAVNQLGWRDGEFVIPSLPGRFIPTIADDGTRRASSGFCLLGSLEEQLATFDQARQIGGYRTQFITSAALSGPLLQPLGQRNFVVHNWGGSGSGKTAALWLAMSAWGNPRELLGTFDASSTGIERKAALHNDLVLGIDEREVLKSDEQKDLSSMLYMLAQGQGRERATITGMMARATWHTIVLTTGEAPLTTEQSKEGLYTRTLELPGGPFENEQGREYSSYLYGAAAQNYGNLGVAFLQRLLAGDMPAIRQRYDNLRQSMRTGYPQMIQSHLDAIACVAVADELLQIWLYGKTYEEAAARSWSMVLNIIGLLPTKLSVNESERAWADTIDWVAENALYFDPMKSPGRVFGHVRSNCIYVIKSTLSDFLDKRYTGSRKILKDWADTGKIAVFEENGKRRYDTVKVMEGSQVRSRVVIMLDCGTVGL